LRKNEHELNDLLKSYKVTEPDQANINRTIFVGQQYIDSNKFEQTSFQTIFLSQIKYIPTLFWIAQGIILLLAFMIILYAGHHSLNIRLPLNVFAVAIPAITLFGISEFSKSFRYGMWELEQSSRSTLQKLMSGRMLIVGLTDLFILTILLAVTGCYYENILEILLYAIVPFNISCACYLFLFAIAKGGETNYLLVSCTVVLIAAFIKLANNDMLFVTSVIWIWGVMFILSCIMLAMTIKKFFKNKRLEGELLWNLQ